ncbi:MAG: STAS domain-containing protein [Bdellovibrionales bacterium]|nr:STAS domain-containing protein [Bdellovibrionales bacterium]
MEAWIERRGLTVVIHLKGKIDYHSLDPFRNQCVRYLSQDKVVFDFKDLHFVGSVGITEFVTLLVELSSRNLKGIKFVSMGNEFKRLFEAQLMGEIHFSESVDQALEDLLDNGGKSKGLGQSKMEPEIAGL